MRQEHKCKARARRRLGRAVRSSILRSARKFVDFAELMSLATQRERERERARKMYSMLFVVVYCIPCLFLPAVYIPHQPRPHPRPHPAMATVQTDRIYTLWGQRIAVTIDHGEDEDEAIQLIKRQIKKLEDEDLSEVVNDVCKHKLDFKVMMRAEGEWAPLSDGGGTVTVCANDDVLVCMMLSRGEFEQAHAAWIQEFGEDGLDKNGESEPFEDYREYQQAVMAVRSAYHYNLVKPPPYRSRKDHLILWSQEAPDMTHAERMKQYRNDFRSHRSFHDWLFFREKQSWDQESPWPFRTVKDMTDWLYEEPTWRLRMAIYFRPRPDSMPDPVEVAQLFPNEETLQELKTCSPDATVGMSRIRTWMMEIEPQFFPGTFHALFGAYDDDHDFSHKDIHMLVSYQEDKDFRLTRQMFLAVLRGEDVPVPPQTALLGPEAPGPDELEAPSAPPSDAGSEASEPDELGVLLALNSAQRDFFHRLRANPPNLLQGGRIDAAAAIDVMTEAVQIVWENRDLQLNIGERVFLGDPSDLVERVMQEMAANGFPAGPSFVAQILATAYRE